MNYLLAGTSKGLIVYRKAQTGWQFHAEHFLGMPISVVFLDERNGNWWICLAHRHWGQKIQYSKDQGASWQSVAPPKYPEGALLTNGQAAFLKSIWTVARGGTEQAQTLYLGTEPGALFKTSNNGQSFELVESLWNHPSRSDENQWFGAGRDHPFIHSIVVDPGDSNHLYIAVSCAGVFESKDGGQSWHPRNKGLVAAYLPNPDVEVGHDPHLLLQCRSHPNVLWQQNHCGVFRTEDGGVNWVDVSAPNQQVHYGFALCIDDKNPLRAWVIPAISDEIRVAAGRALCVCRTEDGGQSWHKLTNGLPQENCYDIVFRHAFHRKNESLAFGTTTGNIYLSENDGADWIAISHHLPRVNSLLLI